MRYETPTDDGSAGALRRWFVVGWTLVTAMKLLVAMRLPLFVDEAFYWQEGQHPALAYSDLPGLTAWLARIGVEFGGHAPLALRAPFLLLGALLPWWVAWITRREFGTRAGWQAGLFALLLPLAGTLGLLALPDVPMAFAALLCVDAGARLLRGVEWRAVALLAAGLVLGALSHYRFLAVIGVGLLALLALPEGRRALRDRRVWGAIAIGAAAWAPLLAWNLAHADAGLRFQLVERHPWALHAQGLWFLPVQVLLVTPPLFAALLLAARHGWRSGEVSRRWFALSGGGFVLGFFVLGFFADVERVSFHWPLPGYLALLPLLPALLERWPRWLRALTRIAALAGLVLGMGYYVLVSDAGLRARLAAMKWYPANFAGWDMVADVVRGELATMPAGTRVLADNFKLGAELGFALGDPDLLVLPHPLNEHHGRAPQLRLWGLLRESRDALPQAPLLLVVGASELPYKHLLAHYHALCARLGPLPPPRVVQVDHGRQRFLLLRLDAGAGQGVCVTPAMAWIDTPRSGAQVRAGEPLAVRGWAFKDGAGLAAVEVLLDGAVVARAQYGRAAPQVAAFWKISTDPAHPHVGFDAVVPAERLRPGRRWLGLRLHGRDGSVEDWPEQPLEVVR